MISKFIIKTESEKLYSYERVRKYFNRTDCEYGVNDVPNAMLEMQEIYFDRTEKDNSKWLNLITKALKSSKCFEIHCWNEETDWIEFALQYGTLKESTWRYGKIIEGDVTPEFVTMILDMHKPSDIKIYNKMTPFFNIFLDDIKFQSCHYGTEIYIEEE